MSPPLTDLLKLCCASLPFRDFLSHPLTFSVAPSETSVVPSVTFSFAHLVLSVAAPQRSPIPLSQCCPLLPITDLLMMCCASLDFLGCPLRDLPGRPLSDLLGCQPGVVCCRPSETFSVSYSSLTVLSIAALQRSPIPLSQWGPSPPLTDFLTQYCASLDLPSRPLSDLLGCPPGVVCCRPSETFSVSYSSLTVLSVATLQRSPILLSQWGPSPPLTDFLTQYCASLDLPSRPVSDLLGCPPGVVCRRPSETFSFSYSPLMVLPVAALQRLPIPLSQWDLSPPLTDILTLCCASLDLLGRPLRDLLGCPLRNLPGHPLSDLLGCQPGVVCCHPS